jgi:hypothetical protein
MQTWGIVVDSSIMDVSVPSSQSDLDSMCLTAEYETWQSLVAERLCLNCLALQIENNETNPDPCDVRNVAVLGLYHSCIIAVLKQWIPIRADLY